MMTKFSVTKKDFEVSWFSGTGGGGQHRNKHKNCCRLKHIDTGIIKTGQSHRERLSNQKEALESMANDSRFKAYCEMKLTEIELGKTIDEQVEDDMSLDKLEFSVKKDNRWVVVKEEDINE